MSMPGKQARVLCPVCQEPMPPDETECRNCGAFVIDEAVVRLSRAFGLDREAALKLFEAGFRHPKQLRDRDPNRVLEKGEVGLLFICTNCGGFVAAGDAKCPRCAAEFETEPEAPAAEEEDILDLVLCPVCGADNDPEVVECEICGEVLRESPQPARVETANAKIPLPVAAPSPPEPMLEKVDHFLQEPERPAPQETVEVPLRRKTPPRIARPAPRPNLPPPGPKPIPTAVRPRPLSAPALRPSPTKLAKPRATESISEVVPSRPVPSLEKKPTPTRVVVPTVLPVQRSLAKASNGTAPRPIARKAARSPPSKPSGFSPETMGGLVLASAAGLLLAGMLDQRLVSAGIAIFLIGVCGYASIGFFRRNVTGPSLGEEALLVAGASLALVAVAARGAPALGATLLALAAAFPFAWATRRLLRTPQRALLAMASAVPIVGQGLAAALDPAIRVTIPWIAGILAATPWSAALAIAEILRWKSASTVRRQVVRAERDVQKKDYEQSLAQYDRAIAASSAGVPGADVPWYGKGATLILLGRYDEALRAIDTALDINPHNEVAWVNKGNALTRMGQLIAALRCFNAAIKVNPRYEVAWNNKGNGLARLGKFEESLRCYERALEIDPGYRGAWVNMGFVLTKLGRFDEAASCADHALRLERGRHATPA